MMLRATLIATSLATTALANSWQNVEVDPSGLESRLKSKTPTCIMVEFYAPWCGHCKELAPKWDWIADKYTPGEVLFAKVDADKHGRDLQRFGVEGFPTIQLHKVEEDGLRHSKKYDNAREPRNIISFVNKHCGTTASADGWKPPKQERQDRSGMSPDLQELYKAFDLMNQFKYKESRELLAKLSEEESRTGSSAARVLKKFASVGKKVEGLDVDQWLQIDEETYTPPQVGAVDGNVYLVVRLDFRGSSRGVVEPSMEEAHEMGVEVVRFTGVEQEVDDFIKYPVAVCDTGSLCVKGDPELVSPLTGMHDAMIVVDGWCLWHGHAGIIDDLLLETLEHLMHGRGDVLNQVETLSTIDVDFGANQKKDHDEL